MFLEEVDIENEYIKLPELHFFAGNKPFETLQELAWKTSGETQARQGSVTSYHWTPERKRNEVNSFDFLQKQIEFLKNQKPGLPLHSLIINKGYCTTGDWLEPNQNWPGGLDRASREIFKDGYRAGIWLAPFAVSEKSKLFEQHKQWIVKDKDNNIIPHGNENGETLYALDGSHPGFQKYLRKVFKTLRKSGFIFYETAHMDWGFKDSAKIKRAVTGKTSVETFREVRQIIREEIGPGSLWMADHVPFSPAIGYIDIVKTGNAANNGWDSEGMENSIRESYFSHYFNNIYWQNYPGKVSLLQSEETLTADEQVSIALWNGILGGAVETTDDITKWEKEHLDFFRFLEPTKRQKNAYLPFWPDPDEMKVAVKLYKNQRAWGVLFFNDKNYRVEKIFDINSIVDKEEVFVFGWKPGNPVFYGNLQQLQVTLEPHQSRLFYLSEKDENPPVNLTLGGWLSENG